MPAADNDERNAEAGERGEGGERGERIARAIARAGLASRREAELWIAAGRVAVNGAVIASPARKVTAADRVTVDGAPLPARPRTRLFLYHKPRGLVTTHADPQDRATIFARLPPHLPRLISVGRLDFNTEGLLLLTNDGGLARVLELPSTGWLRRYRVRAHGAVTQAKLDQLRGGVTIEGVRYGAIEATLDRVQGSNLWLTFAIREGKNREVRNVLGRLGLTVARLIRVSFGPFQLGELAAGAIEEVRTRVLREQLGARLIALAGADFSAPMAERAETPDLPPHPAKHTPRPAKDARPRGSGGGATRRSTKGDGERRHESRRGDRSQPAPTLHSWRVPATEGQHKKLRRRFHGSRHDDDRPRRQPSGELERVQEKREPISRPHARPYKGLKRDDDSKINHPAPRVDFLTDREGRPVAVERHGRTPPEARPAAEQADDHRRKPDRRRSGDRAVPARPRPRQRPPDRC